MIIYYIKRAKNNGHKIKYSVLSIVTSFILLYLKKIYLYERVIYVGWFCPSSYRRKLVVKINGWFFFTFKYSKDYYRQKGEGRPTKKDRREIDGYLDNDERAE